MKVLGFINKTNSKFKINKILNKSFCNTDAKLNRIEEWTKIYQDKKKVNFEIIDKELNEYQKKEVKVLFEHINSLSKEEKKYYLLLIKSKIALMLGQDPMKIDLTQPSKMMKLEGTWPKENSNWMKTNHMNIAVDSFSGNSGGAVGNFYFF
jgi:hypothetical protein